MSQKNITLSQIYAQPERVVITAHRGFSGRYPENTLLAFQKAIEAGADVIEFDLRGTLDDVPVVLHDPTIDRTSNGSGSPDKYRLNELKQLNFAHWVGPHDGGRRHTEPAFPDVTIPSFREVLELAKGKVGLNIQVYEMREPVLKAICRLYQEFDLYEEGYLSLRRYTEAEMVRRIDPRIRLCVLEDQGRMDRRSLEKQHARGLRIIQPRRQDVTPEFCRHVRELGLWANMFFSNTDEDNQRFIGYGLQGILTDCVDVLVKTRERMGRE